MSAHVTFQVQPISKFAGPSEPVRRPKEFACFSYDADHKFRLDDSSMKWYYPPRLGADLSEGFESFDKLDEGASAEHIDSLLQTIIAHEQRIGKKIDAHVVTWRGIVTKDCVFIEEDYASRMESKKAQDSEPWKSPIPREVMTFWGEWSSDDFRTFRRNTYLSVVGYKFETLSTIPKPWGETSRDYIEGRELEPTNNKEQYCSVVRTGIGKTILCIGGEVDAIWDSKPSTPGPINWVELKTSAEVRNDRDAANFERKLLKWWIQSFLLGVPKIVVGFRTRDGHLTRVDEMETNVIPANVQQRGGPGTAIPASISALRYWTGFDQPWTTTIEETGHGRVLTDDFINWRIKLSLGVEPQPGHIYVYNDQNKSPT
ncbi:hypothetical protein OOU_Y34scaffold00514g17 [Pyricularia oryzae Y34]|uniref:Decapping nuclease n=1 Tax=Pyricularia oryzae (strain Y34) TaxID=1143189 RepID=A0AA97NZG3_PYRO3|nr:hypothetical protein OOU_Y34scaffold00514g17 [Pyricularia oryzae Y34]